MKLYLFGLVVVVVAVTTQAFPDKRDLLRNLMDDLNSLIEEDEDKKGGESRNRDGHNMGNADGESRNRYGPVGNAGVESRDRDGPVGNAGVESGNRQKGGRGKNEGRGNYQRGTNNPYGLIFGFDTGYRVAPVEHHDTGHGGAHEGAHEGAAGGCNQHGPDADHESATNGYNDHEALPEGVTDGSYDHEDEPGGRQI